MLPKTEGGAGCSEVSVSAQHRLVGKQSSSSYHLSPLKTSFQTTQTICAITEAVRFPNKELKHAQSQAMHIREDWNTPAVSGTVGTFLYHSPTLQLREAKVSTVTAYLSTWTCWHLAEQMPVLWKESRSCWLLREGNHGGTTQPESSST